MSKFAELALAHAKAMRSGIEVNCPICGEAMQTNGAGWFCYDPHTDWLDAHRSLAYEHQERGGVVFWADLHTPAKFRSRNWDPEMQGVILALQGKWEFTTVRGDRGRTVFAVFYETGEHPECPPAKDGWEWAEWIPRKS